MAELGYDEHELYKKGRFRPATFWRTDRVVLATAPTHRDRCLITQLRQLPAAPAASAAGPEATSGATSEAAAAAVPGAAQPIIHLVNCHLTAGPEPGRRLRQVHDAMDWLRKDLKKRDDLLHPPPPKPKKQKKPKVQCSVKHPVLRYAPSATLRTPLARPMDDRLLRCTPPYSSPPPRLAPPPRLVVVASREVARGHAFESPPHLTSPRLASPHSNPTITPYLLYLGTTVDRLEGAEGGRPRENGRGCRRRRRHRRR